MFFDILLFPFFLIRLYLGKFRSKLKRHGKGAKWARGQSATSNPENKKHRNAARSRFFQPNLNIGRLI